MAELIVNGDILFVVYFIATTVVGIILIAKNRSVLGGTVLVALSLLMLLLLWCAANVEKLGWVPLWILNLLIVVSTLAFLVLLIKKSTRSRSNGTN